MQTDINVCFKKYRFLLPDDERQELIEALKKKWEIVHREY